MLLSVSMAASDALFNPLRIPRKIVVDNKRAELQINALSGCFGSDKYFRIFSKMLDYGSTYVDRFAPGNYRFAPMTLNPVSINRGRGLVRIDPVQSDSFSGKS